MRRGPVFTDILLADEINRTPPKTQAALLEAMEERQVTIDGEAYPLSPMFTVLATENPIEYEGTYPLPEAQLDRFLLKILLSYPSADEEQQVVARWDAGFNARRLDQVDIHPLADADGDLALPRGGAKYEGRARGATLYRGYRPAHARSRRSPLRRQPARRSRLTTLCRKLCRQFAAVTSQRLMTCAILRGRCCAIV